MKNVFIGIFSFLAVLTFASWHFLTSTTADDQSAFPEEVYEIKSMNGITAQVLMNKKDVLDLLLTKEWDLISSPYKSFAYSREYETCVAGQPLYSFLVERSQTMYYTTNEKEKESLLQESRAYPYHGIPFCVLTEEVEILDKELYIPVHLVYTPSQDAYRFTVDLEEVQFLTENGWFDHGPRFYVVPYDKREEEIGLPFQQ